METLTCATSPINRPGGFAITRRALDFCSFPVGSRILDLGCGSGATVQYIRQYYHFEALGLDKSIPPGHCSPDLIIADASAIPLPASSLDGTLMECSLSMMDRPDIVLSECYRVLRTSGRLMISDMYARGISATLQGCLKYLYTRAHLMEMIEDHGFSVELFEDYTHDLQTHWGQMIFDQGAASFYCHLGADAGLMKQIKCGYCLIIARKKPSI